VFECRNEELDGKRGGRQGKDQVTPMLLAGATKVKIQITHQGFSGLTDGFHDRQMTAASLDQESLNDSQTGALFPEPAKKMKTPSDGVAKRSGTDAHASVGPGK
jgi:hypothetical protein